MRGPSASKYLIWLPRPLLICHGFTIPSLVAVQIVQWCIQCAALIGSAAQHVALLDAVVCTVRCCEYLGQALLTALAAAR
jgi:hypothetical protein